MLIEEHSKNLHLKNDEIPDFLIEYLNKIRKKEIFGIKFGDGTSVSTKIS